MLLAAGIGIPEEEMVYGIINSTTGQPISPTTLRKYFAEELKQGILQAKLQGGGNLLKLTKVNAGAAIFFAKTRLHWKEPRRDVSDLPLPGEGEAVVASSLEVARRIYYVLTRGAKKAPPTPAKT